MTEGERTTGEFAAAFNDRDLESMLRRTSEDCVITALRSALEGDYVGHDGVRRWAEGYWEMVPDARITLERVTEVEGRTVVLGRQSGSAMTGGAAFDAPLAIVTETDGGLLRRLTAFPTHADALRSVGLDG
jgi:ketosteroid isomerase-like protein